MILADLAFGVLWLESRIWRSLAWHSFHMELQNANDLRLAIMPEHQEEILAPAVDHAIAMSRRGSPVCLFLWPMGSHSLICPTLIDLHLLYRFPSFLDDRVSQLFGPISQHQCWEK